MQTSFRFELKSLGENEFEGHGSVFGNLDFGGDIVLPNAFRGTLSRHKKQATMPLMYWMHKRDQVPGVWLDMREDTNGLYVKGELVDTQLGRETRTLLQKKAVRGLSIGYDTLDAEYVSGNRLLKEIELHEVSIVSMAMNPLARVESVKARLSAEGEYVPTEREIEHWLREKGCSKSVARLLTARFFDSSAGGMPAPRWDAGNVEDEEAELAELINGLADKIGAQALARY